MYPPKKNNSIPTQSLEAEMPNLAVLRYRFLDQRRYHTPAPLLDCVAHMLLYLDQTDIMMEVALTYLVRTLSACRGDAGVATPESLFYVPSAVYLSPPSAAPTMLGVKVPNRHPALQLVWQASAPVCLEQVEVNPLIGSLREAFLTLRSRSMVARRLEHEAAILGLICIDHTEESHKWQPKELELIETFCQEFLSPLLDYSLRLQYQNNHTVVADSFRAIVHPSERTLADGNVESKQTKDRLYSRGENGTKNLNLSPAELEVIRLAANGLTYHKIAQTLGKSVHTVDKQLRNAREKIGARNQTELIHLTTHLL